MARNLTARFSVVLSLAALLSAVPAEAQGKGKAKGKDRAENAEVQKDQQKRPQLKRRGAETARPAPNGFGETAPQREQALRTGGTYDDDVRYEDDDRWDDDRARGNERWPVAGQRRNVPPGWCKGKGNPHNTPENCGYNASNRGGYEQTRGRTGSYDREHADFHHYLDRKYADLANDRPLDPVYQIRLRTEKKAEHDRWHRQTGTRHQ